MPEKQTILPPNYWRENLKKFRLRQFVMLRKPVEDISWIDNLTEEKAQTTLEVLENLQIMIDNTIFKE